ncbi:MAG TPA: acyl-CoA dehydrogenase family protein [Burkholderiaceae bacterium]|nr:acyl-CoA dehydrogenase family protein [Burkholderiaceae bacterium]
MALARLVPERLDGPLAALRREVRAFVREELERGGFEPQCDSWLRGADRAFSRRLGERGWLGMTWPRRYGGHERSQRERFVVIEELLAAGAPVAGHWVAERQVGPSILRHGTEEMRLALLPPIARGESVFGACYSEPDVGSDLASVRTRAERVDGGWRIHGTKVWTSQGHVADKLIVLCRTGEPDGIKHRGLSMLIVELPAQGVTIRPILLLTGEHHFNQVTFDGVFVPDSRVLGAAGEGWKVITGDLAFERSGPERFMSTLPLLDELIGKAQSMPPDDRAAAAIGELVSRYWSLRSMSIGVAALMERGADPNTEAALVKDLGTRFEADVAHAARDLFDVVPTLASADRFERFVAESVLHSPAYTLRGGANEILRGIVARGLGLR